MSDQPKKTVVRKRPDDEELFYFSAVDGNFYDVIYESRINDRFPVAFATSEYKEMAEVISDAINSGVLALPQRFK